MKVFKIMILIGLAVSSCTSMGYKSLDDGLYADIQTDRGNILLQLEYVNTPITVANFISLAEGSNTYVNENFKGKPFFNGLKFHRVVENFVIQGGDPENSGRGGPGYQFEDEFPVNDSAQLLLLHDKAGILSMANGGPDGNGSQFFITHRAIPHLNGKHTVFGRVVQGQAVVDSIAGNDVMNKIEIIRVGRDAKDFNAPQIFGNYFKKLEEFAKLENEKLLETKVNFLKLKEENEAKAQRLPSGLKIYYSKKGSGEKPKLGSKVNVFYAGYFTSGDLFDSNYKEIAELYNKYDAKRESMGGYNTIEMDYSPDAKIIHGFKEGLQQMKVGDKVMLFIPSHLAYGPQGYGPIPPDTDLVFELEIVDTVK